jgi:hypothetical protein
MYGLPKVSMSAKSGAIRQLPTTTFKNAAAVLRHLVPKNTGQEHLDSGLVSECRRYSQRLGSNFCFLVATGVHSLLSNSTKYIIAFVKERCLAGELPDSICNHFPGDRHYCFSAERRLIRSSARNGEPFEARTTKLHDRRKDQATLSEIERRIAFASIRPRHRQRDVQR